jgi:hypothetical protein
MIPDCWEIRLRARANYVPPRSGKGNHWVLAGRLRDDCSEHQRKAPLTIPPHERFNKGVKPRVTIGHACSSLILHHREGSDTARGSR